jgi:hypothetical protein
MFSLKDWLLISAGVVFGFALFVLLFSFGFSPVLLIFFGMGLTLTGYFCFYLCDGQYLFHWGNLFAQSTGLGIVVAFCVFGILNKF